MSKRAPDIIGLDPQQIDLFLLDKVTLQRQDNFLGSFDAFLLLDRLSCIIVHEIFQIAVDFLILVAKIVIQSIFLVCLLHPAWGAIQSGEVDFLFVFQRFLLRW